MKISSPPIRESLIHTKNLLSAVWTQWLSSLSSQSNTMQDDIDILKDKEVDNLLSSSTVDFSKRLEEIEARINLIAENNNFQKQIEDLNFLVSLLGTSKLDVVTGTWSPLYIPSTGSFATMTMDNEYCAWLKIKQFFWFTGHIKTDNVDITGGSNYLYISGLPYTPTEYASLFITHVHNWAGNAPLSAIMVSTANSSIALMSRAAVTGSDAYTVVTDLTTGAHDNYNDLIITGAYKTLD